MPYRNDRTFSTEEDSLEILSNEIFMLCKPACLHSFGLSSVGCSSAFMVKEGPALESLGVNMPQQTEHDPGASQEQNPRMTHPHCSIKPVTHS